MANGTLKFTGGLCTADSTVLCEVIVAHVLDTMLFMARSSNDTQEITTDNQLEDMLLAYARLVLS